MALFKEIYDPKKNEDFVAALFRIRKKLKIYSDVGLAMAISDAKMNNSKIYVINPPPSINPVISDFTFI